MSARPSSPSARLARLGFADPDRAQTLLTTGPAATVLAALVPADDSGHGSDLPAALGAVADPDLALLGLVRTVEALPDPASLVGMLEEGGPVRDRLLAVLGSSAALGDHLTRHPGDWTVLREAAGPGADSMRTDLLHAVGADPASPAPVASSGTPEALDGLRVAYRRHLLAVAGRDLTTEAARAVPRVAAELADLAAAALEAALAIARSQLPGGCAPCRIAVIGLGKCGGRELNYVSDVDVVYVVEPVTPGASPDEEVEALATGARLAAGLARACSAATAEGTLWTVDAGLRPEGRDGPLVRTLASHLAYYRRWAATWEFQALLKARPVAGDLELGRAYVDGVAPLVWQAAERENFVADVQAMRRRVESNVPPREAERQLKLGAGGLRDVEFSVQLLQLVHGRVDPRLRSANTFEALESLSEHGYVGRDDAAEMHLAYRLLRALEHRIQLHRLRRTHLVPTNSADLRRIGRSFGFVTAPQRELEALWQRHAREVRRLHEKLFYRPLLLAAARLTPDEARLTPQAAHARLAALGYRDPEGAMRHLAALTSGVSRRASIQRQLLPVLLGWFADGADPDAGLLAFRRISDELGSTHWYLKMLRDSGVAAERLAYVLATSRLAADLLERTPESVALLGDDAQLAPRDRGRMLASVRSAADRHDDPAAVALAARGVRRREILRTALADLAQLADLDTVGRALTDATVAALDGGLRAARLAVEARTGGPLPTRLLVVGMGRLGGGELGYGSDADVMFVHEPEPGAGEKESQEAAVAVVSELRRLLGRTGPEPSVDVDPDLRPEGRNGPLVRTLDSYRLYYERWASPWEAQALTRAVPVVGDAGLGERFVALADPVRWPEGGLPEAAVREIRRIKARVESERLPRGADPHRHPKLGRGGLADVEWTVQLVQLRHGAEVPGLRTPSTLGALRAAEEAGLVPRADAEVLCAAWTLASRLRNATVLWRGRPTDTLPSTLRELDGLARILGYQPGSASRLEEDYLRVTRRARGVMERLFYG